MIIYGVYNKGKIECHCYTSLKDADDRVKKLKNKPGEKLKKMIYVETFRVLGEGEKEDE